MKTHNPFSVVFRWGIAPAFLLAVVSAAQASTIWNGPTINFTHSTPTGNLADQWTTNVIITRSSISGGLYNSVLESGAISGISPKDTKWAVGTLANFNTLTYGPCPLEAGNHPPGFVGTTFVVHLTNEDIYLQLTLTGWGGVGGVGDKSFSYTRSTPAAPAPTVSITNPVNGAVFPAPANVNIGASATVSSGTVTNVQFFTNNVLLGSVRTAPFTLTANNLAAGAYALMAVATAGGVSATSGVVNITVVSAPTVTITNPVNGAVFASPANINIAANASTSGGTVTNVAFFANVTPLGAVTTAPFTLTSGPLAAGSYALAAVATAAGISATSTVVNVTVVNPTTVSISGANVNSGQFAFSYTADAGLTYVVQSSSNLVDWVSVTTNVASGSPVPFSDSSDSSAIKFYRVSRLPNP